MQKKDLKNEVENHRPRAILLRIWKTLSAWQFLKYRDLPFRTAFQIEKKVWIPRRKTEQQPGATIVF